MDIFDKLKILAEARKHLAMHEDNRRKYLQNRDVSLPILTISIDFPGFENHLEAFSIELPLHKIIPAIQEIVDAEIEELKGVAHKNIDLI